MKTIIGLLTGIVVVFNTSYAQQDIAYYDQDRNQYENSSGKIQLRQGIYYGEDGKPFNGEYVARKGGKITQEYSIKQGKENGKVAFYYPDGLPMEVGFYKEGERDGKWLKWSNMGAKISEASYKDGKKEGTWIIWDESGNKLYEMNYQQGKKVGTWKMWDQHGKLLEQKEYGF